MLTNRGQFPITVSVVQLPNATEINSTPKARLLGIQVRLWKKGDRVNITDKPAPVDMEVWFPDFALHIEGSSFASNAKRYYAKRDFIETKENEIAKSTGSQLVEIVIGPGQMIRVPGQKVHFRPSRG